MRVLTFLDKLKELGLICLKNPLAVDSAFVAHHDPNKTTPHSMTWISLEEVEESFTLVSFRKSKRNRVKKFVTVARPVTRSQKKNVMSALPPGRSIRLRNIPDRFKC